MTIHANMYGATTTTPAYTPLNRHLLVSRRPVVEPEDTGILLPEGYKKTESLYEAVKVIQAAPNCSFLDRVGPGQMIVVMSNFLEDIEIGGHTYTVILENHVMGVIGLLGD